MHIRDIWRYPVKSLEGAPVKRTVLNPGQGLPNDRRWALAEPGTDAAAGPGWQPKKQFVVLVKTAELAQLSCTFDDLTGRFTLDGPDGLSVHAPLTSPQGRAEIAAAVARHLNLAESDTPVMVEAADIGYFDTTQGPVSLLNLASLKALEDASGQPLAPVRFRMNFWIDGAAPWAETDWIGKRLRVGDAVLRVTKPTGRCTATHVNPQTGDKDAKVLPALRAHFGHTDMGVYAVVEHGGPVRPGDVVEMVDE